MKGIIKNVGAQLWTVRNEMKHDPKSCFSSLKEIGFNKIEAVEYEHNKFYDLSPLEFKELAASQHISINSQMVFLKDIQKETRVQTIRDIVQLNPTYVSFCYFFPVERGDLKQYMDYIKLLHEFAELLAVHNIKFIYHNHDFEFEDAGGFIPYQLFLDSFDPNLINFELDTYWIHDSSFDPIELFKQHPNRFPVWHLKDKSSTGEFTEIGNGVIDFKGLFKHYQLAGLEQLYIEQDESLHPINSLQSSMKNLNSIITH